MSEKIVEETVLVLDDLKVGIGVLKKFYNCTDGLLTTFRLSFKYSNEKPKTIFVSSITSVKMSNRFLQDYIVLQSGPVRYFMSCSDNEKLYTELLRVVKLSETTSVFNRSESVGGICRVVDSLKEKREEIELQLAASDFKSLRRRCPMVKEVLVKVSKYDQQGFNRSIDQIFRTLGVGNLFTIPDDALDKNSFRQITKVLKHLLDKNESILLHEFYCASNRLLITNLLSPTQLIRCVTLLEKQGVCRLHKINRVYILTKFSNKNFRQEFCKDLDQMLRNGPIDCAKLSKEKKMSMALAQIKLNMAEKMGLVVRDDSMEKTTYYYNQFNNYNNEVKEEDNKVESNEQEEEKKENEQKEIKEEEIK